MQSSRKAAAALAGVLALFGQEASGADKFSDIARGIGKAAQKAGVYKVQILPFVTASGEATPEGRMVASSIMSEIIEQGRVLVVEGDLPAGIPDPYGLAMGKKRNNIRPEADAVILGTHINAGSRILIDVQLLRVKDRVVLYSANRKVKNEWEGALSLEDLRPRDPAPREEVAVAAAPISIAAAREERGLDEGDLSKFAWDPVERDPDCRAAAHEVDRLQSSIMDIKARYVALKLRSSGRRDSAEPVGLIQDNLLRDQFRATVQQYLDSDGIPPLTRREIRTLLVVDGKSFEIHRRCLARS